MACNLNRERKPNAGLAAWIGVLLGAAGGLHGVVPVFGSVRPWHVLVLAAFLVAVGQRQFSLLSYRPVLLDLLLLMLTCSLLGIESADAAALNYVADLSGAASFGFYYLSYVSARAACVNRECLARFIGALVVPAVIVAMLGILQVLRVPLVEKVVILVTDNDSAETRLRVGEFARATSLIGHWTALGAYLVAVLSIAVALLATGPVDLRKRSWIVISIGVLLAGSAATLTFSIWASAVAVTVPLIRRLRTRTPAIALGLMVTVSCVALYGDSIAARASQQFDSIAVNRNSGLWGLIPDTLLYRVRIWETETLPTISERPELGWGRGAYGYGLMSAHPATLKWPSAESQWLYVLVSIGWFGFAVFVAVIGTALFYVMRSVRIDELRWIAFPVAVLAVAMLAASLTAPVFTGRGFPLVFWPLIGCIVASRLRVLDRTARPIDGVVKARLGDVTDGGRGSRKV